MPNSRLQKKSKRSKNATKRSDWVETRVWISAYEEPGVDYSPPLCLSRFYVGETRRRSLKPTYHTVITPEIQIYIVFSDLKITTKPNRSSPEFTRTSSTTTENHLQRQYWRFRIFSSKHTTWVLKSINWLESRSHPNSDHQT